MKRQLHFPWVGLVLLMVGMNWSASATAQMTGFVVEVDTVFYGADTPTPEDTFDPEGTLDGYASFIVYAEFTNPTDVLSAVFADTGAGSSPMGIDAPCGCHNPVDGDFAMNSTNTEFLWDFFPLNQYDTFWTIGMLSGDATFGGVPGVIPSKIGDTDGSVAGANVCAHQVENGLLYVLPVLDGSGLVEGPPNAIAGDDLRVEVARVTTCGDWTFSANCQVFVNGDQDQEQQWFIEDQALSGAIEVAHPCLDYASEQANVSGVLTTCPGDNAEVGLEFLGSADVPSTAYDLYAFPDGFTFSDVEETILDFTDVEVVAQTDVNNFSDVEPGDYAVLVLDAYGCMDTTRFTVVAPEPIEAMPSIGNQNSCFGEADASIVIPDSLLVGGTGDLSVTVLSPVGNPMGGGTFTDDGFELSGLVCLNGDGTYEVTTTDDNGCFRVDTVYVNCPEPIEWNVGWTDVVCAGASDGTIVAEASGGSGGELYLTNNQSAPVLLSAEADSLPLTASIGDLGPTLYQVWVYDALNCTSDTAFITVEEPAPLELIVGDVTNPSCGLDCDGAVDVTAIGGSGELTVGYFNQTSGTFFTDSLGLCAGEYIVTVTDTSACETAELFTIEAPDPLGFLIFPFNATCTGMSDGSVDIFPKGGTVTLGEWDWFVLDTAGQVANLNNLSEMTYTAHVTDQVGCTHSETFDIGINYVTDMELSTLTSPVTCWGAADGTATVSVNGGEAPFTFEWSDPFSQTASTAVGLTEDTYTVVVTDALGCRRSTSQSVEAIEGCLFIADALTPNNDGKNDDWIVGGLEDFPQSRVVVVNRWGQRVFETQGGLERWDGRFNGQRLPVADYYYTIELNPGSLPIRGTVTIKY
ncbi:MAG: gliding motility-associated C-terminal domain-containing protein [Flavobacteriales bacterium]